jgi:TonB family protein
VQRFSRKAAVAVLAAISVSAGVPASAQSHGATSAPATVPSATPIGSPASWFPADAYPPSARAAGMQGRTAFTLDLDAQGRITSCNITSSSGSPLLDSTTCNLLVSNARFKPAHDPSGRAVAGTWSSAMVWKLAADEAPPPETINDAGSLSPAEAYNESLTQAKHASEAASDPDQGKDSGN